MACERERERKGERERGREREREVGVKRMKLIPFRCYRYFI